MDAMKHIFIGLGHLTGNKIDNEGDGGILSLAKCKALIDNLKNNSFIGIWKNEKGRVYIEQSQLLEYKEKDLDLYKLSFPKEEALFIAEIVGIKPLQGNILDALAWQILELKELEGATYQIKDNELFKLEVINGELK